MALYASQHLLHGDNRGLPRDGNLSDGFESLDLNDSGEDMKDGSRSPPDSDSHSGEGGEVGSGEGGEVGSGEADGGGKSMESGQPFAQSPLEDDRAASGRPNSAPICVPPGGGLNSRSIAGILSGSPSLASLGTSPGGGSVADMWRLWADDLDEDAAAREFPLIMPPTRRSLSLKTKKTPPGTPSPKKMVRFADAMGLDLEKVRHFMRDQLPNTSAAIGAAQPVATLTDELNRHPTGKYLTPSFPQPCLAGNFLDRIRQQKVCLDSVQTQDFAVNGLVRVLNISFEKGVVVRYTFDNWRSSMDMVAQYVPNSNDNFSDRFQFTLNAPPYLDLGQMLQFAICYTSSGDEFWDSNYGQNYCLNCCAGAGGIPGFNTLPHSPSTNAFL